jgi:hypothetical protein
MAWTFEVTVDLKPASFDTIMDLSLFSAAKIRVTLDFAPGVTKKGTLTGGIKYECKHSPTLETTSPDSCYCEMWNLERIPIDETSKISTKLLKDSIPDQLRGVLPGSSYYLTQPSVRITPDMHVTSTNGGKCYNVFVDVKAEFTPGQISISLPSFQLPGTNIKIPLDAKATVGTASEARLRAEYSLCCCEWNDDLPTYNPANDGDLKPADNYVLRFSKPEKCKCDEHIKKLSCDVTGDTAMLSLKITAVERDCTFDPREASGLRGLLRSRAIPKAK